MRRPSRIGLAAALAALGLGAGVAHGQLKRGARFEKGGSCVECHADVGKARKVEHAPMAQGDCTACHKPHGLVGALRLTADEPKLCLGCHQAATLGLEAAHRHPQVEKCSRCHDPHGSDHAKILKSPERELCTSCHKGGGFAGKVVHAPVGESCLTCHQPHGAAEAALLAQPREALCASCHDGANGFAAGHGVKT